MRPRPLWSGSGLREAREQLRRRQLLERGEHEVGVVQLQAARRRVRHGDAEDPCAARRAHAVGRVLERDRLRRCDAEQRERLEVEIGPRLRARLVVVGGDDRVPADLLLEPRQVQVDPRARGAGDDRALETAAFRLREVLGDPGPQLLRLDQRELVRPPACVDPLALDRCADELLQVLDRLEAAVRTDSLGPAAERQLVPVLLVHALPRREGRHLGVEDEAVEVEEEGADHLPILPSVGVLRTLVVPLKASWDGV